MKNLYILFLLSIFSSQVLAQAHIVSISVHPPNPTIADMIEVHVEIQTSSSPCPADWMDHSVIGTSIDAGAHHCSGALTAICNNVDTFELGMLSVGTYTFDMTLTNGYGGTGCSPGIVIDDTDQIQFTVYDNVGIHETELQANHIYPNPVSDLLYFAEPLSENALITDLTGRSILTVPSKTKQIDLSQLPNGVYTLQSGLRSYRIIKE